MSHPRRSTITATQVHQYVRCEHSATHAFFSDPAEKTEPYEGLRLLFDLGIRHEAQVVEPLGWPVPEYPNGDWEAGRTATLALMRSGAEGILQGVLFEGDLLGKPDLLRRVEGDSELGPFYYEPGDVKSSAEPTGEQVLQVAFYGHALGLLQGRTPEFGYVIDGKGREHRFELAPFLVVLDGLLEDIRAIRDGNAETRLHLHPGCGGCEWRNTCRKDAEALNDVSLVPGLRRGIAMQLYDAGIRTVEGMAEMDVGELAKAGVAEGPLLQQWRRRARAVRDGKPTIVAAPRLDRTREVLHVMAAHDPVHPGQLLALGIRRITNGDVTDERIDIPGNIDDARKAWQGLLEAVASPGKPAILQSGGLSPATTEELRQALGGAEKPFLRLHDEAVNLPALMRRSVALETPSASLRAFTALGANGEADPFEDGPGRERRFGGPFGHHRVWHERWRTTGDDEWKARMESAARAELDALGSLEHRLRQADQRALRAEVPS